MTDLENKLESIKDIENKIAEYDFASKTVCKEHWISQYYEKQRDEQIKKWEGIMKRNYNGGVYGSQRELGES